MARIKTYQLPVNSNMNAIIEIAAQNISMQGFDVKTQIIGPTAAEIIVSKDREGFKNFLGLGLESRIAVTAVNDTLNTSSSDEWTNKVIAIAVGLLGGWLSCGILFVAVITGIIGLINQYTLTEKIDTAFNLAVNSGFTNVPNQAPVEPTAVEFNDVETPNE